MKLSTIITVLSLSTTLPVSSATVTDVLARQQWPWNTKVNVDYRLTCEPGECCDIGVEVVTDAGRQEISEDALSGDFQGVAGGERRLVWNPAASGFSAEKSKVVKFVLTPKAALGRTYMVIDLSNATTPGADVNYSVSYLDDVPAGGWTAEYKTTKIVLRRIRAGKFMMGCPDSELGFSGDSQLHEVTLTKDFYISIFPVTQKQFTTIDGEYECSWTQDDRPIMNVSWEQIRGAGLSADQTWPNSSAVAEGSVIDKLRKRTTLGVPLPAGYVLDLPTEARWEYACRAGTTTAWNNGTDISVDAEGRDLNLDLLGTYAVNPDADGSWDYGSEPAAVGLKLPNRWGIYDMHGNMSEWCLDYYCYGVHDPVNVNPVDPVGFASNPPWRVVRGGSWRHAAKYCRSAWRMSQDQTTQQWAQHLGFRLALISEVKK